MTSHNYNDIIRQIIQYMPNYQLRFNRVYGDICRIKLIGRNVANMDIEPDDKIEDIKRALDVIKKSDNRRECGICLESIYFSITSCRGCGFTYCFTCMIEIIRTNKGCLKCPQCRNISGEELPPHLVECAINDIIKKDSIRRENSIKLYVDTHT